MKKFLIKTVKIRIVLIIIFLLGMFYFERQGIPFVDDYPVIYYILWIVAIACMIFNTIRDIKEKK